jgi:hypothetical protein
MNETIGNFKNSVQVRDQAEAVESTQEFIKQFHDHFPEGNIQVIGKEDVPEIVMEHFEKRSAMYILPDNYHPGNFEAFYLIIHDNGDKTYLAKQTKVYEENDCDSNIYSFDIRGSEALGYGRVLNNLTNKKMKNQPIVEYFRTFKSFHKQGLGTRRLFMLNALARAFYGAPLNSSTTFSTSKSLWEKLERDGKVKKVKWGNFDNYVFI